MHSAEKGIRCGSVRAAFFHLASIRKSPPRFDEEKPRSHEQGRPDRGSFDDSSMIKLAYAHAKNGARSVSLRRILQFRQTGERERENPREPFSHRYAENSGEAPPPLEFSRSRKFNDPV
mmetsp:Transcript_22984/g.43418  ORF Transcript_22984/g.43418 Transcript_22984/m.43418 type:complete len:119 (+) Transcript_22984:128-484(+)